MWTFGFSPGQVIQIGQTAWKGGYLGLWHHKRPWLSIEAKLRDITRQWTRLVRPGLHPFDLFPDERDSHSPSSKQPAPRCHPPRSQRPDCRVYRFGSRALAILASWDGRRTRHEQLAGLVWTTSDVATHPPVLAPVPKKSVDRWPRCFC
jgi:hypothetical protein